MNDVIIKLARVGLATLLKNAEKKQEMNKKAAIQHIFITGVPGAGKTMLAQEIARELGMPHVEMDKHFPILKPGEYDQRTPEEVVNSIKRPSVIEGVQLLEMDPKDMNGKIEIVDVPDEELIRRYIACGHMTALSEKERDKRYREDIDKKRKLLNVFMERM